MARSANGDVIRSFAVEADLVDAVAAHQPDIGLLTAHATEGGFPDFAGSAHVAQRIGLKTAVPAHYGCFRDRTCDPQAWAEHCTLSGTRPLTQAEEIVAALNKVLNALA